MNRATAAGSVALVLWALLALLSRTAASLPPFQLTAMTFAVCGGLGLIWLWVRGELHVLRLPAVAWVHGVGGLFGYHALFFAAFVWAPAAEANLLNYMWPLFLVLFSAPVLGLRLTGRHLAGVGAGFCGCMLLLSRQANFSRQAVLGYLCALGAAAIWALYSVTSRRLHLVPTKAVIGFCAATGGLAAVAHLLFETTVIPDGRALAAVLMLGVGPTGSAFLLWDYGMKKGDPRLLGALGYAVPVASTIMLGVAGFAPLSLVTVGSAVLVVAGGWLAATAGDVSRPPDCPLLEP